MHIRGYFVLFLCYLLIISFLYIEFITLVLRATLKKTGISYMYAYVCSCII